jgi:hypothetical protein
MISHRKRAANQRNSARSTGPRTSTGKVRSSRNALRHGLAIAVARDAAGSLEIERLSKVIAGGRRDPVLLYHARIAAEAELEIMRVRAARAALINETVHDRINYAPLREPEGTTVAVWQAASQFSKYDRYECRALSRRRRALRALDLAVSRMDS